GGGASVPRRAPVSASYTSTRAPRLAVASNQRAPSGAVHRASESISSSGVDSVTKDSATVTGSKRDGGSAGSLGVVLQATSSAARTVARHERAKDGTAARPRGHAAGMGTSGMGRIQRTEAGARGEPPRARMATGPLEPSDDRAGDPATPPLPRRFRGGPHAALREAAHGGAVRVLRPHGAGGLPARHPARSGRAPASAPRPGHRDLPVRWRDHAQRQRRPGKGERTRTGPRA